MATGHTCTCVETRRQPLGGGQVEPGHHAPPGEVGCLDPGSADDAAVDQDGRLPPNPERSGHGVEPFDAAGSEHELDVHHLRIRVRAYYGRADVVGVYGCRSELVAGHDHTVLRRRGTERGRNARRRRMRRDRSHGKERRSAGGVTTSDEEGTDCAQCGHRSRRPPGRISHSAGAETGAKPLGDSSSAAGASETAEASFAEVEPTEICGIEIGPTEIGGIEIEPNEIGPTEISGIEIGPTESGLTEIETGPTEIGLIVISGMEIEGIEIGGIAVGGTVTGRDRIVTGGTGPAESGSVGAGVAGAGSVGAGAATAGANRAGANDPDANRAGSNGAGADASGAIAAGAKTSGVEKMVAAGTAEIAAVGIAGAGTPGAAFAGADIAGGGLSGGACGSVGVEVLPGAEGTVVAGAGLDAKVVGGSASLTTGVRPSVNIALAAIAASATAARARMTSIGPCQV